jgi:hypothetical protein
MKKIYPLIVTKVKKPTLLANIHKRREDIENNQRPNKDIVLGMGRNRMFGRNFPRSNEVKKSDYNLYFYLVTFIS